MWQPIETAPKDGYPFLAYVERYRDAVVLRFVPERWDASGWQVCGTEEWMWQDVPTYWQPLPEPPAS